MGCGSECEGEEGDCTEWRGDGGGYGCGCEFDMKEWGEGEDMDWDEGEDEDWSGSEEEGCRGGRRGQGVTGEGGGRKEGVEENWELDQKRPRSYLIVTKLVRRTVCFPQVVVPRRGELARDPSERGWAWTFTYEGPKRKNDPEEVKLDDTPRDCDPIFNVRGSSVVIITLAMRQARLVGGRIYQEYNSWIY